MALKLDRQHILRETSKHIQQTHIFLRILVTVYNPLIGTCFSCLPGCMITSSAKRLTLFDFGSYDSYSFCLCLPLGNWWRSWWPDSCSWSSTDGGEALLRVISMFLIFLFRRHFLTRILGWAHKLSAERSPSTDANLSNEGWTVRRGSLKQVRASHQNHQWCHLLSLINLVFSWSSSFSESPLPDHAVPPRHEILFCVVACLSC